MNILKKSLITLGLAGFVQGATAVPMDYLALYEFEAGNAQDSSANGNDGTVKAGVSFTSDVTRGNVAAFASGGGIDTHIDVDFGVMPAVTFGGWFKHTNYGSISKTLSTDDGSFDRTLGLDFRGGTANEVSAFTGTGVLGSNFVPALNEWYFSAVSYDGTSIQLYVNDLSAISGADSTTTDTSINTLHIGVNPGFSEDLLGFADDVFVYDRALSAGEISDIYRTGFAIQQEENPVPAPTPLALLGLGLGLMSWAMKKKPAPRKIA